MKIHTEKRTIISLDDDELKALENILEAVEVGDIFTESEALYHQLKSSVADALRKR